MDNKLRIIKIWTLFNRFEFLDVRRSELKKEVRTYPTLEDVIMILRGRYTAFIGKS